jgi:hypothetical protein
MSHGGLAREESGGGAADRRRQSTADDALATCKTTTNVGRTHRRNHALQSPPLLPRRPPLQKEDYGAHHETRTGKYAKQNGGQGWSGGDNDDDDDDIGREEESIIDRGYTDWSSEPRVHDDDVGRAIAVCERPLSFDDISRKNLTTSPPPSSAANTFLSLNLKKYPDHIATNGQNKGKTNDCSFLALFSESTLTLCFSFVVFWPLVVFLCL